jgi:hypothetical protein
MNNAPVNTLKSQHETWDYNTSDVRSEAFKVVKGDKIFWGYQPCQLVKNYRRQTTDPEDGDRDGTWSVSNF